MKKTNIIATCIVVTNLSTLCITLLHLYNNLMREVIIPILYIRKPRLGISLCVK